MREIINERTKVKKLEVDKFSLEIKAHDLIFDHLLFLKLIQGSLDVLLKLHLSSNQEAQTR